jgi:hypothetical protein
VLKHNEHNLSPHLRQRQFDDKEKRLNKILSSKIKLEPLKLVNHERDIQGIRIEESQSIQASILPKL